jgi:MHS family proline/betaine transporter-like MFS transporter
MNIKSLSKEVWIGWISSMVEAYNMAIYSFIAPILAASLFQQIDTSEAVFFSYALVFVGACLLYPLGAFYYGYIGDKKGRQKTCVYSTLGLAIATGLMGVISFRLDISWIVFLFLIGMQHFFSGGEYYGSIIFSLEHGKQQQNGLMSALSCLFAVFGIVMANGLATISSMADNLMWIRICFFLGGIGGIISFVLKKYCCETPAFLAIEQKSNIDNWSVFFKSQWQTIIRAVLVLAFYIVSYSFIFMFLPLVPLEFSEEQNFDTFKSLIAYGFFLVFSGVLADQIGMQKTMLLGVMLFAFLILPLCYWCRDLFLLQIVLTACASLVIAPIHGWILHQFEAYHRCRGIFVSSAIVISIFYGSTVPLCLLIYESFHSLIICCIYPLCTALICIGSLVYSQNIQEMKARRDIGDVRA